MAVISRRTFASGLLAGACVSGFPAFGQGNDPGGIAIIDTPDNAAKGVSQLLARNVKMVARYYARREQSSLAEKIMSSDRNKIGNDREPAVLARNGIAIVSAYQYQNNRPAKFVRGLDDTGTAAAEAAADGKAALDQATLVQQPEGTAIYFGVDFNLTRYKYDASDRLIRKPNGDPMPNSEVIDAVLEYFRAMGRTVGQHYALGVYGNGYVNRLLRTEKLVKYSWISASRAFEETSDFFNTGQWHLFQNQVDRRWFETPGGCPSGLDIDTNIQNPGMATVGAWGASEVEVSRTRTIFDQRRFAIRATQVRRNGDGTGGAIGRTNCRFQDGHWTSVPENTIPRNGNVRIVRQGVWAQIDIDDDGVSDGYARMADLTTDFTKMPQW
jgi:Domain of unknown function (DUF1906)